MTADQPSRADGDRRAGAGLDRHAVSAPGELPRRGHRLPRAAARALARGDRAGAGGGAELHAGLVGAGPVARICSRRRGRHLDAGGAARGARRATCWSSACATAASPSMSASWRGRRAGDATLIHAYSGHGVVESPLTPAWARRIAGVFRFPDRRC